MQAIEALKEQVDLGIVKRPGAFLAEAINHKWQSNQPLGEIKNQDTFSQWYDLAKKYGIVKACCQEEEKWLVQENTGAWVDFDLISQKWTLDYLKSKVGK